jgi:predicted Zn-dependent peptidase
MSCTADAELARIYETVEVGEGTRLHVLSTPKWKTVFIDVFLRRALDARAAELAILPFLLKRGTNKIADLRAMTRRLEELFGASIASDILKVGESQVLLTRLEIANPKFVPGAPRLLEEGLDLLRDLLFDPRTEDGGFPLDRVEQEKRNLARTIEGLLNDKTAYASERCCEEMCRGEPFGLYEYGRLEDVRALAPRPIYDFYREAVDRCPMDIFMAGDVTVAAARELVAERFAFARAGDLRPAAATPHPPPRAAPREVVEERPVKQGKLVMGLRSDITARSPEFPALLLANAVLGGFPHSKLFRVVREQEGLCYYASSSIEKTKGVLVIASGIDAASYERARALIEAQLEAVRRGDVTDEELEKTRKAVRRNFTTIADSPARLATHWYTGLVNGRTETVAAAIAALDRVSAGEIAEAARRIRLDTVYFLRDSGNGAAAPPPRAAGGNGGAS